MFSACICSKYNIAGFSWHANGSPAQLENHWTVERSNQDPGCLFFKLYVYVYIYIHIYTFHCYEPRVLLVSCYYISCGPKEEPQKPAKDHNKSYMQISWLPLFSQASFLLTLLACAPVLGSSVLAWGAGDQRPHTRTLALNTPHTSTCKKTAPFPLMPNRMSLSPCSDWNVICCLDLKRRRIDFNH